jgi:hypothetical protein
MTDEAAKQTPTVDATESLADDYRVGPGRPPMETRWKKGKPSPNPKGRPRNNAALTPDVKKLFEDVLNRKVTVTRNGRQKLELGFEQLANQFAKGDRHARRDVFTYAAQPRPPPWLVDVPLIVRATAASAFRACARSG